MQSEGVAGGESEEEWQAYFIPGTSVLHNRIGATTTEDLESAESDLIEARLFELADDPDLLQRSYDLTFMQAIHRHLFQDVYDWAGELRTVGVIKDGENFCTPDFIERAMLSASTELYYQSNLVDVPTDRLPPLVAKLYDYVNFAHPFREGNGRTTRVFFDMLLSESGRGLNWHKNGAVSLDKACHEARSKQDVSLLCDLFEHIIEDEPTYEF